MKLDGNVVLITGGATGIGFELAKQLHQRSNTVIITGRDTKKLARAKEALPELHTIQSDVSKLEDARGSLLQGDQGVSRSQPLDQQRRHHEGDQPPQGPTRDSRTSPTRSTST